MFGPFCIMVSLCGDIILRSRIREALVNTLLLASLHIHEAHRGLPFYFCFFFGRRLGELGVRFLVFFL
jgi:hypothetical protein